MEHELIAQRYKPLFTRARGGFGEVVVAWDTRLTRRVAIKRINTARSLPATSLEEARTVALLQSPNIVSIYDVEHVPGETLIIMENVDGPSLAELMMDSAELLDLDSATAVLAGMVAALEYAHENQVLHLDIKPANILIDQQGHIKVSDFGLSELAGSRGFGSVQGGTLGYMPPEQLTGGEVDERSDVWALAALAYQLLTGANPFMALSPKESLLQITELPYALPSTLRPELGGALDAALISALAPLPANRPANVGAFWAGIQPYLGRLQSGRRKLKHLAGVWAGREAGLLAGDTSGAGASGADGGLFLQDEGNQPPTDYPAFAEGQPARVAIWNGTYEGEATWAEASAARRQQRAEQRAERQRAKETRGPQLPLWQRLAPEVQLVSSRLVCAFAALACSWLALSALPYLGEPLAQAATAAAVKTGSPAPALLDAAFAVRVILSIALGILAFVVPSIGSACAVALLCLGIYFTGNWILGLLVLLAALGWWLSVGRHSPANSAVFTLAPAFSMLTVPLLLPIVAGYFLPLRRALITTALAAFFCGLLALLTGPAPEALMAGVTPAYYLHAYGQLGTAPLLTLLGSSASLLQMPDTGQLFIPLVNLLTSPEFWLTLAAWLGTTVVMSLLCEGQNRVKWMAALVLGLFVLAAGYLLFLLVPGSLGNAELLPQVIVRLILVLAVGIALVVCGVDPKPDQLKRKGRRTST